MITKPATILALAAADMNDSQQGVYTHSAMLPYFNMAVKELFELMQENNIPLTDKHSGNITVTAGITEIPYQSTTQTVLLPPDLVEPEKIWESGDGGNSWSPMTKIEEISPNLLLPQSGNYPFSVYEWRGDKLIVPLSATDIILRITYIRNLIRFPIVIEEIDCPVNTDAILFLTHKTAALCATFIAQDETRATSLNELAEQAIERELNIPTKGRQQIVTRRKPFRQSYKIYGRGW